jgi:polysaccharide pyruvyl transferase WcaK-like protein
MSDYFPIHVLESKVSRGLRDLLPEKYIVLQMGRRLAPSDLVGFIKKLKSLSCELGMKVVCCPIGLAEGHEDDIILKKICSLEPSFDYIDPKNLYDIMYTIARADVYMGTSLHGLITSLSFGVKFIPMNKAVHKMSRYCQTWTEPLGILECIDYDGDWQDIAAIINNWDIGLTNKLAIQQKAMVYRNFDLFFDDCQ